jgi:hypothetical protein
LQRKPSTPQSWEEICLGQFQTFFFHFSTGLIGCQNEPWPRPWTSAIGRGQLEAHTYSSLVVATHTCLPRICCCQLKLNKKLRYSNIYYFFLKFLWSLKKLHRWWIAFYCLERYQWPC